MRYIIVLIVPVLGYFSLLSNGVWSYFVAFDALIVIALLDVFVGTRKQKHTKEAEKRLTGHKGFKALLYLMIPIQYGAVWIYLNSLSQTPDLTTRIGLTLSMGVLCGVTGINVAHELGHKQNKLDQFLAKLLLLSSSYMHFFIEHNEGHHRNVGQPGEPGTALKGEAIYPFYFRALVNVYRHAWKVEKERLQTAGVNIVSAQNRMLQFLVLQLGFWTAIVTLFNWNTLFWYLGAALIGVLLLESLNYVEHYGLVRKEIKPGIYESISPKHSWNSDHWVSRTVLFDLPLHADHHIYGSKEYQVLNSREEAPQMPLGYAGMILMALVPPIWFRVMNKKIDALNLESDSD